MCLLGLFPNQGQGDSYLLDLSAQTTWCSIRSLKARPDHLNNPILLLRRHLVVTGQAQPPVKDIPPNRLRPACDIRIGLRSQVAIPPNKPMHPIHRLTAHRAPDRPSLRIDATEGFQYLCWTAFPMLRQVQRFRLVPHLPAHDIRVNDYRRQPVVWFTALHNGVHPDGQPA